MCEWVQFSTEPYHLESEQNACGANDSYSTCYLGAVHNYQHFQKSTKGTLFQIILIKVKLYFQNILYVFIS